LEKLVNVYIYYKVDDFSSLLSPIK